MSVVTSHIEFMKHRWLSVYGAYLAVQVDGYIREGRGSPDAATFAGFKLEAAEIANMDAEGE